MTNEKMVNVVKLPNGFTNMRFELVDGELHIYAVPTKEPYALKNRKEMTRLDGIFRYESEDGKKSEVWVPFWDLTVEDFADYIPETDNQKKGAAKILAAIKRNRANGTWITAYEISVNKETDEVQSVAGEKPAVGYNSYDAEKLAKQYDPENQSYQLDDDEYMLVMARAIKDKVLTWAQVFDDSKDVGNYYNSPESVQKMEKTGGHVIMGISNLIGNTWKILKCVEEDGSFSLAGGSYGNVGSRNPAGDVVRAFYPDFNNSKGGVIVALSSTGL